MSPIYNASPEAKLRDLQQAVSAAICLLEAGLLRDADPHTFRDDGLREGEFAVGNWIVRPRWPAPKG